MNTKFFGHNIIKLKSVDSTNKYAIEIIPKIDPIEGAVVWALEQEHGRGRNENIWESESGKNLTISIILYPDFIKVEEQFYISKAVSLGVFDYINQYSDNVKIKWPNDIYVRDNKISGILIENKILKNVIQSSVVGIGINVNQTVFKSKTPNPTSLKLILKNELDLNENLEVLCTHLEKRYIQLQDNQIDIIDKDYNSNLYRLNEFHRYEKDDKEFTAKIKGVMKTGSIILELESGEKEELDINSFNFII